MLKYDVSEMEQYRKWNSKIQTRAATDDLLRIAEKWLLAPKNGHNTPNRTPELLEISNWHLGIAGCMLHIASVRMGRSGGIIIRQQYIILLPDLL
jgi:hypothetical protein